MENTLINRKVIKKIAHALGELNERVVYVGGAVVSLYANDPAADDVRPTKDLDISMEIASVGELEKLRQELLKKGFAQKSEDKIICRFRYDDVKVDVMATKEVGWAPANEWFKPGFDHLQEVEVDGQKIRVQLPAGDKILFKTIRRKWNLMEKRSDFFLFPIISKQNFRNIMIEKIMICQNFCCEI